MQLSRWAHFPREDPIRRAFIEAGLDHQNPIHWRLLLEFFCFAHFWRRPDRSGLSRTGPRNNASTPRIPTINFAHFSHIWGKPGMTPYRRYEELWRELELCDQLGFDYSFC